MPVTPTYPGVYIEEIPSGVRTITGVATSITAFVGRAARGPLNEPITINSYSDFERTFGGLSVDSTLGYVVQSFYLNGGSQAIIVRVANGAAAAKLTVGAIPLEAASGGGWGNYLRTRVDHNVTDEVAKKLDPTFVAADLFNLTVRDTVTGATEVFRNLTGKDSARRVDKVLANESNLARVSSSATFPLAVPSPNGDPTPPKNIWNDDNASTKVEDAGKGGDGNTLSSAQFIGTAKHGIYALDKADLFNILCIPPYTYDPTYQDVEASVWSEAAAYCEMRRAFLIVDPPHAWNSKDAAKTGIASLGVGGNHAAVFFPRLVQPNSLHSNQLEEFVPSGAVAGIFARTDTQRGVWKAPAGLEATLVGVPQLTVKLTDPENGELNPLGVNCLRTLPAAGRVVWGSRTLQGDDRLASEWKYIPVRRLALFIEESLYRGTQWVVFEPNDEPLWSQIRLNIGAFMHNLFRQGAFAGTTPSVAYFVKCDKTTTTPNDINLGIVNIVVGFAPLKPAEFVILQLQQMAGSIEV